MYVVYIHIRNFVYLICIWLHTFYIPVGYDYVCMYAYDMFVGMYVLVYVSMYVCCTFKNLNNFALGLIIASSMYIYRCTSIHT